MSKLVKMSLRPSRLSRISARARAATVLTTVFIAIAAPRVYAQLRIGIVDLRRVVSETAEGRAVLTALKARFDDRQGDLDRRTKAIEVLKRRIEHPASPIPQPQLQKMAQNFQQQVAELQQIGQQYSSELQELEAEMTKRILAKAQPLVRQIGQDENYQIIVDQQIVHFAPAHLNLTDRVIQMYNQAHPQSGPVSLPTAGAAPAPAPGSSNEAEPTEAPMTTAPASQPADGGHHTLPGVFFRRDAGHP